MKCAKSLGCKFSTYAFSYVTLPCDGIDNLTVVDKECVILESIDLFIGLRSTLWIYSSVGFQILTFKNPQLVNGKIRLCIKNTGETEVCQVSFGVKPLDILKNDIRNKGLENSLRKHQPSSYEI